MQVQNFLAKFSNSVTGIVFVLLTATGLKLRPLAKGETNRPSSVKRGVAEFAKKYLPDQLAQCVQPDLCRNFLLL